MKILTKYTIACMLVLLAAVHLSYAQAGKGSYEMTNGFENLAPDTYKFIYAESLYLGPDTKWEIDGEVHIYSKQIWFSPTAKITGSGTIYIHSPSTNPYHEGWAESATLIDGNDGEFIDVNIVLDNNKGIRLTDFAAPGYAGSEGAGAKSAALKVGKSLELRVDGANIFLNGYDLELSSLGDLLDFNIERMVVTEDKLTGHMIKNYAAVGSFIFPVGIAERDYTPATLVPQTAASKVYVSVNSYGASNLDITDETLGMDRVWNIFADRDMRMTYTLSHNRNTNGIAYVDAEVQIMQNADGGNWIGDVTTIVKEGIHTRLDIETVTGNTLSGTWFTKFGEEKIGPDAIDDEATMIYGSNVTITVLENDEPGSSAIVRGSVRVVDYPKNGTVEINPDGSIKYTPNQDFVGVDEFTYEITDENGLTDIAKVTVTIEPRDLFIPNVITPNGDGTNDYFVIVGREAYDRIEVIIVNRWGNEVYKNNNYKDEWDGHGLSEGTYYPIIRAIKGSNVRDFKSHVLIKRN